MGGGGGIGGVVGDVFGASVDPLNLTGYGGIPGVNASGGGGKLVGDLTGANARDAAIEAQTQGMNSANSALAGTYAQQQGYLNPYNQAGTDALGRLSGGNIVDQSTLGNDQGYQFRLAEGNKAINNAAAARGMGNSGATLKALTAYGSNVASDEYDKAYNREYNRLSNLTGMGANAANNLASAAGSYGSNLSNNYMGLGNATAAANIAQGNQFNNLVGQGIGAAAAFSDERLKKNLVPVSKQELDELRKELKAFHFEYKDELHGEGRWIGIKAQDLEKSKLGKTIVVENEKGEKMIDIAKVMSVFLATMAEAA